MNAASFEPIAEALPFPCLLVTTAGEVVAVNSRVRDLGLTPSAVVGRSIGDLFPSAEFTQFLRLASRSRGGVPLRVKSGEGYLLFQGSVVTPLSTDGPAMVLLRTELDRSPNRKFAVLTERMNALGKEIDRRSTAEHDLREQRDIAAFGRDVGIVLVKELDLRTMLTMCTDLIVEYFGAAFARIWRADHDQGVLVLEASSGMYTHLNGDHARIPFGELKIGQIAAEQAPCLTNQVVGDPRVSDQEWAERENMVAFAGYPLVIGDRTVGVMALFARHELSQGMLDALASIALGVALGIERKRMQQSLEATVSALREAHARKNEFLAMLGHELRNPLVPIVSGLDLLEHEPGDAQTIDVMRRNLDHIVRLVDDLLDLSRIDRGRIELKPEPIRLDDVLADAVRSNELRVQEKRHTLTQPSAPSAVWINADRVRMTQVFSNLIHNATKYTPEGGRVAISVHSHDDTVEVHVRDSGIGIRAEMLERVFDLFTQETPDLDRADGGLGIGLTVAQSIVNLHGGSISVSSTGAGGGSEFAVRLPLSDPSVVVREAAPTPSPATRAAPGEIRVLIVDDNRESADTLSRLIIAHGYRQVSVAYDGYQALERAESVIPHVVFLDIGLPGIDGLEVARRLREHPKCGSATLIAVTGYGTAADRTNCLSAGFDQHLVKPVGANTYLTILGDARP